MGIRQVALKKPFDQKPVVVAGELFILLCLKVFAVLLKFLRTPTPELLRRCVRVGQSAPMV